MDIRNEYPYLGEVSSTELNYAAQLIDQFS